MIVQIYSLTSVHDAVTTVEAGVDLIGVIMSETSSSQGKVKLSVEQAAEIFSEISSQAHGVALSLMDDADSICRMAENLRPWAVHLAAHGIPAETVLKIRDRLSPIRIISSISVEGDESVSLAREYASCADIILLDSRAVNSTVSGGTGRTHDWNISRRIVESCGVPVILAGGLAPENVAAAINVVRPWGVDSFTLTDIPGQRGSKDIVRVKAFIETAKNTDIS